MYLVSPKKLSLPPSRSFDFLKLRNLNLIFCILISATLITAAAGTTVGWTSPTLPILLAEDSPIQTSKDQSSWIASFMILCSGNFIYLFILSSTSTNNSPILETNSELDFQVIP